MINFTRVLMLGGFVAALPAGAVYAPIPEPEMGKDLVLTLKSSVAYDSNLFAAASDEVDSMIFSVSPKIAYNRSLSNKTFFSAAYAPTLDYFENRPGDKLLDSHDASLRVAHAFTPATTIDIFDTLTVARNPESALPGVGALPGATLNPDQSFTRNQIDGRFQTPLAPKSAMTLKVRSVYYDYRNAVLGRALDRIENLYGATADYALLPELKLVAELRHLDVFYRKLGETKNKSSNYAMVGADYFVAKKLSVSGRAGAEWRSRENESDTTAPYVELSGKYDFGPRSFFVGGYAYTFDETSDTIRFTDTQVHRVFANVQHALTALIVGSASASFEPSVLQGRRGQPDVDEDTWRLGAALSYVPTQRWTVSLSYDFDHTDSQDAVRNLQRHRAGLSVLYSF
jgi:opacity protein-like surface antigen